MELNKAETESLKKQLSNWLEHQDYELESTFGRGTVDATTFFQIAQRLRSKGLRELSQEDRLTITTPEHVRFTIQSMGVIQQYCRDDTLSGKPFAAMIKDRASADAQVDFKDYEVRVKTRREILMANDEERIKELFSKWPNQKKGFRMMRRWSFEEPDGGIRYDLSIVRSTARSSNGEFKWQRKFTDQDISNAPYLYEVEVELMRKDDDTVDIALKRLIKGIGEVLRGIQKSSILMRKSKKDQVIESYKDFIKSNKFLGCYSITLQQQNFSDVVEDNVPNIRTGYNVTDKADGLRCLGYTNSNGEFYLIDMSLNVYRTGLQQKFCRESIIDGEWVTRTSKKEAINQFLVFDIYYAPDKKIVSNLPFYDKENEEKTRYIELKKWVETFNKGDGPTKLLPYLNTQNTLQISMKTFLFGKPNDFSIFKNAAKVLDTYRIYYTDGLIFTPNNLPLPGYNEEKNTVDAGMTFYSQFKWKPAEDNTIDFLVRFEKMPNNPKEDLVTIGINPETNETIRYKTLRLYVGSNRSKSFNPRDILLNERKTETHNIASNKYKAIPFYPKEFYDSMASVCYGEIKLDPATQEEYVPTEHNNEPIQDKSIIEMRYDTSMPRGWRWIPLRIRHDKTERFQKGMLERTLNSEKNANGVWSSIHEPITETMIRSGSTQPNEAETKGSLVKAEARDNVVLKYFERKAAIEDVAFVRGMRDFHNHYIKDIVLYSPTLRGGKKIVLDIACGTGSDIRRWANNKVGFVFGIDYAGDNITNPENGAYAQYANFKERNRNAASVPPMVFAIGDSSKRIIDGRAGSTDEERDIMRSIFGRYSPIGPIPSYIDHEAAGNLKAGADVMSCMFALHYFFEKKESLDGVLRNIRECLKLGGYFIGCCFDGASIFNLFKETSRGGVLTGVEKEAIIWNLRKDYDIDELSNDEDCVGLKINVDFVSIGSPHDEYLVNFPYFVERMKEHGMELLTENELKEVGLKHSTNLFSESYDMSKKIGKNYIMADSVKKFSFLNRWFIFRKRKEVSLAEEEGEKDYVPIVNNTRKKNLKVNVVAPPTEAEAEPSKLNTVVEKENYVMPVVKDLSIQPETTQEEKIVEGVQNAIADAKLVERTVPVEKGSAAPTQRQYATNEVINFYMDAALDDKKLKIGDKGAARWLAPSAPFPIKDMEDKTIEYPSIEHFMAGMMYKYGADRPDLAQSLFSDNGSIHRAFVRKRLLETEALKKAIPEDKDFEFLKEESADVKANTSAATFRKYKAVYNESKYVTKKDELLQYAVEQRYKKDARLRKILEAARINNKYLLFFTRGASNNLGGTHKADGKIMGDNKLGKMYMSLAGYSM